MKRFAFVCAVSLSILIATISLTFAQNSAKEVISKMIQARGGADKLSSVKTCVMTGQVIMVSQGGATGDLTVTMKYPDKVLSQMLFGGMTISQGYDGTTAWMDNPMGGGYQELPEGQALEMKHQAIGDDAFLNPDAYGISYTCQEKTSDSTGEYHLLKQSFKDNGQSVVYYVDADTYLIYKTRTNKGSPVQPMFEEVYFSDYRQTDGTTQAHQMSTRINGQEVVRVISDRIEYNVVVDDATFRGAEARFTKAELIADARQLAGIIEDTHPDPYKHIGGKISFHRHLWHVLEAIPDEGMTKNEFAALLCPFIAAIAEAHTEMYSGESVNPALPGGIPLKFDVAEQSLYVSAVPSEDKRKYLGAVLLAVENIPVDQLGERMRKLKPIDNEYHLLWQLSANYLWYGPYLQNLLPEWQDTHKINVTLRLVSGETSDVAFDLPVAMAPLVEPSSKISLPMAGPSGLAWDFLGSDKKTAYVRIDHMKYFRETFEARNSLGLEQTPQATLDSIPSATKFFRDLVQKLKDSGTQGLIVDLRQNYGGDALMADIMMYFLYGKEAVLNTRWNNVTRLSKTYLDARKSVTLEGLSEGRTFPYAEGDYDFNEDYSDAVLSDASALAEGFAHSPTFYSEWQGEEYAGYYCPEQVIVLTRPWTFSAGFGAAVRLYRAGAVLVGTPSAQAPNSGGNAIRWQLDNTGLIGRVAQSYVLNFPDDSELARVLPVQYPMKLGWLASHYFDPNAEVLYALELIPEIARR